ALLAARVPDWKGLEGEVECLLAARVLVPGKAADEPPRFRTDEIRAYFIATFWAGSGKLARAKERYTDERFAAAYAFLPRMLEKAERDELGRFLERANKNRQLAAWEQYRKHWRRRRDPGADERPLRAPESEVPVPS